MIIQNAGVPPSNNSNKVLWHSVMQLLLKQRMFRNSSMELFRLLHYGITKVQKDFNRVSGLVLKAFCGLYIVVVVVVVVVWGF